MAFKDKRTSRRSSTRLLAVVDRRGDPVLFHLARKTRRLHLGGAAIRRHMDRRGVASRGLVAHSLGWRNSGAIAAGSERAAAVRSRRDCRWHLASAIASLYADQRQI